MIVPILIFFVTSILLVTATKASRVFSLRMKHQLYLEHFSQTQHSEQTSPIEQLFTQIDMTLANTTWGRRFKEYQQKYLFSSEVQLSQILFVIGGTLFICWNLSGFLHISFLVLLSISLMIGIGALMIILKKKQLNAKLEAEFPGILDSLASVYQINPDLKQSFLVTEALSHTKVSTKFLKEINSTARIGVPMSEALEMTAQKWLYQPLFFFISAVKLHQHAGGDLSELFRNTASALRRQQQNKKAMHTVMFQNKISALLVCSLVPIILLFSLLLSENYRTVLFTESTARLLVTAAVCWWLLGAIVMWRALRVRV